MGRWVDNIKIDVKELGCKFVSSIHLAQDRVQWCVLVNMVIGLRVP